MENIFPDAMDAGAVQPIRILLLPISLPPMSLILNGLQSSKPTENGPSKPILENIWLAATVALVHQRYLTLLLFMRPTPVTLGPNGVSYDNDLSYIIL
jgi:hypothetical protein